MCTSDFIQFLCTYGMSPLRAVLHNNNNNIKAWVHIIMLQMKTNPLLCLNCMPTCKIENFEVIIIIIIKNNMILPFKGVKRCCSYYSTVDIAMYHSHSHRQSHNITVHNNTAELILFPKCSGFTVNSITSFNNAHNGSSAVII